MPFLRVCRTPPDCLTCQMIKCTLEHFACVASAMQIHFRKHTRWTNQAHCDE